MKIKCPHCARSFELQKKTCKRCGHAWQPRKENILRCPRCKSPYWDKERKGTTNNASR